jgi:NDP-sugar pyrophosphorylase family protein
MKGVILAAGKGTRMREVSLDLPKILLPLGERTIGDNLVEGLKEAGVSEIFLIVAHMEEMIREHFGDGSSRGVRIHYVQQDEPLGTGHAAGLVRDLVDGESFFMLAYGDIATPTENCAGIVADFQRHRPAASLSVYRVTDPSTGAAVYVENGYLKSLVEKPPKGSSGSQFDNAGIYVFTPKIFEMLARIRLSPRKEYELTDAVMLLVENGDRVRAYEFGGFWSNVSSPEDLLNVNRIVIDKRSGQRRTPTRRGAPDVELSPLAFVHPRATVRKCSIGPYTVVDRGAEVMEGARATQAIICRNAVVGRGAILDHALVRPGGAVEAGMRYVGTKQRVLILPDEG